MAGYDLKNLHMPMLAGRWLSAVASSIESPLLSSALVQRLLDQTGVTAARATPLRELPTAAPFWPPPAEHKPALAPDFLASPPATKPPALPFARARDYHEHYRSGALTPEAVGERVLRAIAAFDRLSPPLRAFIASDPDDVRKQALASAARFRKGRPLGVLDGVPVAIKDELDQIPYATTKGTVFWGGSKATRDATVVARLRAQGALLIGKANMHEIGIQPTGSNVHHGHVRNPYNRAHDSGGSSSGSAAAVAAGLCPIAIGADGGGSVRIPAALCGVVGLKATYSRISVHGPTSLCPSVAHVGPLAASVEDAVLAYAAIAGPDPDDPTTLAQPMPSLAGWDGADLKGVRLGIYRAWFEHAESDIVAACNAAVERLVALGASVQAIEIPELERMRVAHSITIIAEMTSGMESSPESPRMHAPGVRVMLGAGRRLRAADYLWAQRARTQLIASWAEIFRGVDLIVTPTTAITAPRVPDPLPPEGYSSLPSVLSVMRFIVAGNFLGFPALTLPVGYDTGGLPIGLHLFGRAWEEALLFRAARLLEGQIEHRRPATFVDLLEH
jgi:Asp-tRNA(Asn)/Glu-tRNA(Gln) amidotransferase A subunit family amidase